MAKSADIVSAHTTDFQGSVEISIEDDDDPDEFS